MGYPLKNQIFVVSFLIILSLTGFCADNDSPPVNFVPGTEYCCSVNSSTVIQLPVGEYNYRATSKAWELELIQNYLWVKPKINDDAVAISIRNSQNQGVVVLLKSTQQCETPSKIIVQEIKELESKAEPEPEKVVEEKPQQPAKEEPVEPAVKSKKIDLDTVFGVQGGIFNINKKNYLNLGGDLIVAGKSQSGFFFQGAAMAKTNGFFNRFGQSVGIGMEPKAFGLFVFADMIQTKLQDYDLSFHLQVRPSIRIKTSRLHLSAFYALPVITEAYTGVDDPVDPELGIYNKAIPHFGFEAIGLIKNRILINLNGLIGSSSIFKVGGGVDYQLGSNFLLSLHGNYYNFGDYSLLVDSGYGNAYEVTAGISYGVGKKNLFTDLKKRLYIKPDYPLVVQVKQAKKDNIGKTSGLYITLDGYPSTGYAPLPVNFSMRFGGGIEPYTVEFKPLYNYQPITTENIMNLASLQKAWIYTEPGNYTAKAWITDSTGKRAESNEVSISVLKAQGTVWTITVKYGPGGSITPETTQVANGADSPVFLIKTESGYVIDYVLVDGSSIGTPSEYQFKNVTASHTLEAYFRKPGDPPKKYTITASSGAGGSIDPSGAIVVNAGGNQSFTITASTGYVIDAVLVDGSSIGSPLSYTFTNIQADHTIEARFRVATFTIKVDHSFMGHTVPGTGTYTVNYGGSFTIQNIADTNCAIDYINVDGNGVPIATSYTFFNVTANHTYYCAFKDATPPPTYRISTWYHVTFADESQWTSPEQWTEKIDGESYYSVFEKELFGYPNSVLQYVTIDDVPYYPDANGRVVVNFVVHSNVNIWAYYKVGS